MAKKDRKCICCGTKYQYCPDCGGHYRFKPTWYSQFCSEECKELWSTATKFNMSMLSKQEAKEVISALTLKDHSEYVECVQRDLKNILGEPEVKVEEPAVEAEPAVVEQPVPFKSKKQKAYKREVVEEEK